jgi:hypothetical protein
MSGAPPISAGDTFLPCPACGYDLRGAPIDRCPECGVVVDADALRVSGIPWAHRRRVGRVRAYLRTVRQVSFGSAALALEPARPQDQRDARAFHRVTAALVVLALLGLFAIFIWVGGGGFAVLAFYPPNPLRRGRPIELPLWTQDLYVPWSAGAIMWPVIPIGLILLAYHLTAVQRAVFRLPLTAPVDHRRRARALAAYAAGPLVLLVPAVLLMFGAAFIARAGFAVPTRLPLSQNDARRTVVALMLTAGLITLYAVAATAVRVARWLMRSRHCGIGRALLGMLELAGLWLAGVVLFLGVLPWVAGFLFIVVDSLR